MAKKLVAYFSASGVTKKVAERLNEVVQGNLFEIVPEQPYTSADLNWTNPKSRSSVEMNDKSFRPAVKEKISDMWEYDIIYLGFPICWYIAPTIINTFLEQYDLRDKTIIPFATSGMSGMGKTNDYLENSCKGARLMKGQRFDENVSADELSDWVKKWNKRSNDLCKIY